MDEGKDEWVYEDDEDCTALRCRSCGAELRDREVGECDRCLGE